MSNRLVRKYFKCHKCKDFESQLIHPNKFQIKCQSCGAFLNEISEKEFKVLKKSKNQNNEQKTNNDAPYMPSENAFRNISSVYNRPPSRTNHPNQSQNSNNINFINRNRFNNNHTNNNAGQQQRNRRYQSTNHYTDMNIVNDNNRNSMNNMNHINNNINTNLSANQFRESQNRFNRNSEQNSNNNENENERQRNYGQGARNRDRSQDPSNSSIHNNLFNNIFGGLLGMSMGLPVIISTGENQPFRIYVQRQNVPQNIFDPMFLLFGSMFNNNFRDNFSSNFRSNFRGDFLNEIIRILERNQEEAARRRHPPTSESALKKLKRFPLTDKYCKKDKNGKFELPSCCICLSDIEKNEETVLLPCGHMFHWNCCLNWLKGNNTCPMCRFVIKD